MIGFAGIPVLQGGEDVNVASLLLAFDCIDAAMWWTAVAGAGAIFTVRGQAADQQQARALQR